jgi:CheY-like chemotaxis protein
VIWNLLSNAIKFTPKGGRVEIQLERVGSQAQIVVVDSGSGIPVEFLPHVFDRFRQADSSITRTQGGLGLGLAIVRHLVEVHGGTVEAHSEGEGKGARFVVRLPIRAVAPQDDDEAGTNGQHGQDEALLGGIDVLVVEDEPDSQDLVVAVLARHGATVRVVGSVEAALEALRQRPPTVLLSDIGLPRADGYQLMEQVRLIDPKLPAAALTAFASVEDHRRVLAAGFQAHVTKPVDPTHLAVLVATLAGRSFPGVRAMSTSDAASVSLLA